MAETGKLRIITKVAAVDLSANQYNFVRDTGNGQINVASFKTSGMNGGVLMNKPSAALRHASVAIEGRGKVVAGGAINTAQIFLCCNGSGRAAVAGSGDIVLAQSIETAAADGDIISVELVKPWRLTGTNI
jgi:hypothetical protein